jgi:hypothetical protein
MHDAYYVILGALAGAIVSNDTKIQDFQLVHPKGWLFLFKTLRSSD